jgi:DNA-binding PucR family transcriptional regulator
VSWQTPSARAQELIRAGAEVALNPPAEWLAELDAATLATDTMRAIAEDPVLNAATRRTNRSNLLFWAAANLRAPGAPVPPNLGDEPLGVARDLVRRGLDESSLDAYRIGQGVALRLWMRIVFSLTSDAEELREVLEVSTRSIADFVDATVAAISAQMRQEREDLTRGSHAERLETVVLLLEGAPIPRQRAEARLGHALARTHTAAVVWSDDPASDLAELDRAADALAATADVPHPLTVMASAASRWVWVHGRPDLARLRAAVADMPSVRVAVGSSGRDVDGFRRSHLDALTTQRMLTRLASPQQVVGHDEVELVSLVTQDDERAELFVQRTLGRLETAPPDVVEAVRTFVACGCNASRTAARLFTHRNTVLRRLERADQLLPRRLADDLLDVAVALEVLRWRGPGGVPTLGP